MTNEQITTVVGGILDVLDMIDHNDWQGEAIQDLRNTLEPTPALPPELGQCVRTIDGVQCRNRRKGAGISFCSGPCDFTVESKPAPEPPTSTLPLGIERCVMQYDSNTRCRNRRLGEQRTCGVNNKCDFGLAPDPKPAPPPVLGMEAVTIANAALTSWHADSTANLEQLCVEVVRATEKHHGITQ